MWNRKADQHSAALFLWECQGFRPEFTSAGPSFLRLEFPRSPSLFGQIRVGTVSHTHVRWQIADRTYARAGTAIFTFTFSFTPACPNSADHHYMTPSLHPTDLPSVIVMLIYTKHLTCVSDKSHVLLFHLNCLIVSILHIV